jgi:hypothetical protein
MLKLQPVKDHLSEREFWAKFDEAYPSIFGALLDVLSHGLKQLPNVHLDNKIRMADFQLFGHACEEAYAKRGSFAAALAANATEQTKTLIHDDIVVKAINAFMAKGTEWEGTMTTLINTLKSNDQTEEQVTKHKTWPKDPTRFSKRLREVSGILHDAGIEVEFGFAPDANKSRLVTLRKTDTGRSDTRDASDATDTNKKSGRSDTTDASDASDTNKSRPPQGNITPSRRL